MVETEAEIVNLILACQDRCQHITYGKSETLHPLNRYGKQRPCDFISEIGVLLLCQALHPVLCERSAGGHSAARPHSSSSVISVTFTAC